MWTLICVSIAFAIYLIYNGFAIRLFGIPKSLSDTFYLYKQKKNWLRILFPIMMISLVILLLPAWLEISVGTSLQFLAFLASAGIMFTGAAPAFMKSNLDNKVHTYSALAAAVFALLWVIFVSHMWWIIPVWLVITALIAILTKSVKKSLVFWLETVAFLSTFISIIGYYFL